ncbi:unnamed protein product (mitochondrion) [Plasmodiophora brassicae]|uniref:Small-subunit processome Utp12 domain-containing protein n=1 Tax=Plasmodiophora brassicae TaxID=37360 RepID=A0A0G4J3R8_PLABS|nr:hypothetical protein PBRA_002460 [Plasmodiophora brassicae]SPQ93619.1 unnamed protein product [Plasmodiophora brassicae]
MVKAYLRYEQSSSFGVVYSPTSDVVFDVSGRLVLSGSLESLQVWNVKQGALVTSMSPERTSKERPISVTRIAVGPDGAAAAGYSDGSIRLWNTADSTCIVTLNGHRGAVSALRFNKDGSRLASGSNDTDIIMWDVIAQAGLFRLRGHIDAVTDVCFVGDNTLLSSSKDTFVKRWQLTTQHCAQTLVGHHAEVWSLDVDGNGQFLVTGSTDAELRLWSIPDPNADIVLLGAIPRSDKTRVNRIRFSAGGSRLLVQGTGNHLELFRARTQDEIKKKVQRRQRRLREKGNTAGADEVTVQAADYLESQRVVRTEDKQRSFSASGDRLAVGLADNSIAVFDVSGDGTDEISKPVHVIDEAGHRSGVRAVCLSRDDTMIASASRGSVKVWNLATQRCVRTLPSGYGLCIAFVPGDQHVLVGTKTGHLELYSLGSAQLLQRIEAHSGALWSIDVHPSGRGFVTGGADHDLKFWIFELIDKADADGEPTSSRKRTRTLGAVHSRTLRLDEDVLFVKFSPDGRYVAVAMLDATIRVFHEDSLKFYLSLYGHRLPALCMDISSDGTLLCSAGADKSLKIWGLDFGDCHKSLLAHDDSVMAVKFVPGTHYVFTASKDKQIRFWDADKFEQIYALSGHQAEVWGLAVSRAGRTLVSAGNDRSIRVWSETEEQVFLEEERETRLEELFEEGVVEKESAGVVGALPESGLPDPTTFQSASAVDKQSLATVRTGERLMEAIDFVEAELASLEGRTPDKPSSNPMLLGLTPFAFMTKVLSEARPNELEVALVVLPFTYAKRLLLILEDMLLQGDAIELYVRCVLFLLQTHHQRLIAADEMGPHFVTLRDRMRQRLRAQKDLVGYNMAAITFLKQEVDSRSNSDFYEARDALSQCMS